MVLIVLLRDTDPYPIAWLQNYGDGRVFYNAMGHGEDVWKSQMVRNFLIWILSFHENHSQIQMDLPFISLFNLFKKVPRNACSRHFLGCKCFSER